MVPPFPVPPDPEQVTQDCPGDAVCLSNEFVVGLGMWIRDVYRYHEVVSGCPGLKEAVMAPEVLRGE